MTNSCAATRIPLLWLLESALPVRVSLEISLSLLPLQNKMYQVADCFHNWLVTCSHSCSLFTVLLLHFFCWMLLNIALIIWGLISQPRLRVPLLSKFHMYGLIVFYLCSLPWKQGRKSTIMKSSIDHVLNERNKNNEDENHPQIKRIIIIMVIFNWFGEISIK